MNHQNPLPCDNVSHRDTNNKCNDKDYLVNLLVKKKIKTLSIKTSNSKRVQEYVTNYMGIQVYHQQMLGKMWLMRQFLTRKVFPQETKTLARKVVFNSR